MARVPRHSARIGTAMISPVGALMNEATAKAAKAKTHVHTAKASCGCQVTVSHLSPGCQLLDTERCTEHAWERDPKTGKTITRAKESHD